MIKPAPIRPGDTIGIVAAASAFDKDNFIRGVEKLRSLGFRVKYERAIFNPCWSKPGHNRQRAAQINRMYLDPKVKAILCAKAGYGSIQILPFLNKRVIRRNPKIFVGYSDITNLLLFLQKISDTVVFHGPVVANEIYEGMNSVTLSYLERALTHTEPLGPILAPHLVALSPGRATGRLAGGNLSLITAMIGTPYSLSTEDSILFLEEVDETLEQTRRFLFKLRQAGKFRRIRGVLFGQMVECFEEFDEFRALVAEVFAGYDIPILFGFPSGHKSEREAPHVTLPLGVQATIDADKLLFQIDESGVA
ncbi:MAG: LD-carboxypeptidase [Candidatus Omnitrophica bacterium]|nr:LD-carboxypeptidase [Candidatus Omnitrophota bacterium]